MSICYNTLQCVGGEYYFLHSRGSSCLSPAGIVARGYTARRGYRALRLCSPANSYIELCCPLTGAAPGCEQLAHGHYTVTPWSGRQSNMLWLEHSNSAKKSFDSIRFSLPNRFFFDSIRFGNLINLPLVHWYSNSKLGVIFIVCIAFFVDVLHSIAFDWVHCCVFFWLRLYNK